MDDWDNIHSFIHESASVSKNEDFCLLVGQLLCSQDASLYFCISESSSVRCYISTPLSLLAIAARPHWTMLHTCLSSPHLACFTALSQFFDECSFLSLFLRPSPPLLASSLWHMTTGIYLVVPWYAWATISASTHLIGLAGEIAIPSRLKMSTVYLVISTALRLFHFPGTVDNLLQNCFL